MKTMKLVAAAALALSLAACTTADDDAAGSGMLGGMGAGGGAPSNAVDQSSLAYFTTAVGDRVFFDTASSSLSTAAQSTLNLQADWLKRFPDRNLTLQGHADERGSTTWPWARAVHRRHTTTSSLREFPPRG